MLAPEPHPRPLSHGERGDLLVKVVGLYAQCTDQVTPLPVGEGPGVRFWGEHALLNSPTVPGRPHGGVSRRSLPAGRCAAHAGGTPALPATTFEPLLEIEWGR